MTVAVAIEVATKRCFATALDWPGWCRAGRDEQAALDNLIAYGGRYGAVVGRVSPEFAPPASPSGLAVVEHLPGTSSTEFGAPGSPPSSDAAPVGENELERLEAIVRACWEALDATVAAAQGVALTTGPRGGGRALDAIVRHVTEAEGAYIRRLGAKVAPETGLSAVHEAFVAAVEARARGDVPDTGPRGGTRWPARFAVRYAAWHVLDHAWEIEDRTPAQ